MMSLERATSLTCCASADRAVEVASDRAARTRIALLTGGDDRPYALGMASALASQGFGVDFVGSDKLDAPELRSSPRINFLNLRRDQNEDASLGRKVCRIVAYYLRLIKYAAGAQPRIFHLLWNNRFEFFDRTFLMLYYRLLGKKVVLTAHNVNIRKRDRCDSWLNRFTLRVQYQLCSHILVHTDAMKKEMTTDFDVSPSRISVIPFGINNTTPRTEIGRDESRQRLGLGRSDQTLLFFGQIAPYKGLEYLVRAMGHLARENTRLRLIIAGRMKPGHANYWAKIKNEIGGLDLAGKVLESVHFIPDTEVEFFFKAADAVVIPYIEIFQSGVPFLSYSFGLPVIATDVGSLRDDIIEAKTGFLCKSRDSGDLARAIRTYFASELYEGLERRRGWIREFANERNSWAKVGNVLDQVYRFVLADRCD